MPLWHLSTWLTPKVRGIIARVMLFFGGFAPGLAIAFAPGTWANTPTFHQLGQLPFPLWAGGIFLILASLLIIKENWRDIGYTMIAMYYAVLNISAGFAIENSLVHHVGSLSALVFVLPVMLWLYLEGAITASRAENGNPTQFTEHDIQEG